MAHLVRSYSWSPDGTSRKEVHLSLLPQFDRQTRSFAGSTPVELENNRVFGGIERRVRLDPPEQVDVSRLAEFSFRFQQTTGERPLVIAFVNSRSGGQTGRLLMETLQEHIGPPPCAFAGSVCDLSRGEEPAETISGLAQLPSPRLLVCGGDGTVTWILTELENCQELQGHSVPVAVLPLGTGNDLARSLGWGGRLRRRRDLLQYLQWVAKGEPVHLDQWELVLRPHAQLPDGHKLRAELGSHPRLVTDTETKAQLLSDLEDALPSDHGLCPEVYVGFWQNYYEIGFGAKVVNYVDTMRNNTSTGQCLFRSGLGKVAYARNLCHAVCQRRVTDFIESLQVAETPEAEWQPLAPPLEERPINGSLGAARELVFANINSMAAGLAGRFLPAQAAPDDGLLELLLWRNTFAVLGTAMGCASPSHPASAGAVALRLSAGQFMEVDGEPWEIPTGCDVLVRHHKRVKMLRAPSEAHFWHGQVRADFWTQELTGGRIA